MKVPSQHIESVQSLLRDYLPLINTLNAKHVDFCIVGGLAVAVWATIYQPRRVRATYDMDLMVSTQYTNYDFANDYLKTFASEPATAEIVYNAVIGDAHLSDLSVPEFSLSNIAFDGAVEELDGIETPDFDVCRMLNGFSLDNIKRTVLELPGCSLSIATVDQLIEMKSKTIELLRADIATTTRPQDFSDLQLLRDIREIQTSSRTANANETKALGSIDDAISHASLSERLRHGFSRLSQSRGGDNRENR